MAELPKIDRPPLETAEFAPLFEKWLSDLVDQLNDDLAQIDAEIGNRRAVRTADIGGGGAGPISVAVTGMTAASIIVAQIQSSTNIVSVAKATATATGFDILFDADPGASCFVNYQVYLAPKAE